MAALSIYPVWKIHYHAGRSRGGGGNNHGVTDHCATGNERRGRICKKAGEPVNVIYQTAEDGLGDTIKPRLLAAVADCSKVLVSLMTVNSR